MSRSSLGLLVTTVVLTGLGVGTAFFPEQAPEKTAFLRLPAFDLQGHRGYRGRYPENTLPAVRAALATGVTTLELDVVLSADGVPVVHHDPRLDPARTRDADGAWIATEDPPALAALSLAELQAYDVGAARPGSRVRQRFPDQATLDGVHIPSLEEVMRQAEAISGASIRYNLETKSRPGDPASPAPAALADAILAVAREVGAIERVTIQSFDWRSLARVEARAPDVPTAALTAERSWLDNVERGEAGTSPWTAGIDIDRHSGSLARAIGELKGEVWSPYYRDLRPADLHEAHRMGIKVVVWTVNDPADMASLLDLGVDGIITDYPGRLRAVMEKRAMTLPPAFGEVAK